MLDGETVWLTQALMAELYETTKQNISLHVRNILAEGELEEDSVVKESLTTAADGKRYRTLYYSLPMIIAVGYRVRSDRGTQFRRWATERLRDSLTLVWPGLGHVVYSADAGFSIRSPANCR